MNKRRLLSALPAILLFFVALHLYLSRPQRTGASTPWRSYWTQPVEQALSTYAAPVTDGACGLDSCNKPVFCAWLILWLFAHFLDFYPQEKY